MDIVAFIGAASGVLSLMLIGYTLGVWKGRINVQISTLWKVYVVDELIRQRHNDLVGSSDWHIKEKGKMLLPDDLKKDIENLCHKNTNNNMADMVERIGVQKLSKIGQEKGVTVQTIVALIYAYCNSCAKGKNKKG